MENKSTQKAFKMKYKIFLILVFLLIPLISATQETIYLNYQEPDINYLTPKSTNYRDANVIDYYPTGSGYVIYKGTTYRKHVFDMLLTEREEECEEAQSIYQCWEVLVYYPTESGHVLYNGTKYRKHLFKGYLTRRKRSCEMTESLWTCSGIGYKNTNRRCEESQRIEEKVEGFDSEEINKPIQEIIYLNYQKQEVIILSNDKIVNKPIRLNGDKKEKITIREEDSDCNEWYSYGMGQIMYVPC